MLPVPRAPQAAGGLRQGSPTSRSALFRTSSSLRSLSQTACARALLGVVVLASMGGASAQSGLLGEYYDNGLLNNFVESKIDPVIDFLDWGQSPTGTSVNPDNSYSERWTGFVSIAEAGEWTFTTNSNDGVRLWIDDVLSIDHWTQHAAALDSATMELSVGWHAVKLEHFQQGGGVAIQLSYAGPNQLQTIIPSSSLSPFAGGNQPPVVDAGTDVTVTLPTPAVLLTGTADDPDGAVVAWAWTQLSGPTALLINADSPTVQVRNLDTPGTLLLQLMVTDDEGATASDVVSVQVVPEGAGGPLFGSLIALQPLHIDFTGPALSEQAEPNPFLDYRLDVEFEHAASGTSLLVPGFYAADGDAGETSADAGSIWRVRFRPELAGAWDYRASFRTGTEIAISSLADDGTPLAFDGFAGSFAVSAVDPQAPGFLADGFLRDVGEHYWRFSESGRPFLKGGADSPENLLGYTQFDQTPDGQHVYAPHVSDWQPGDPEWQDDRGKGLIGALNYLAGMGMNSVYFLTFNVGGDGDDVWPWTAKNERERFDVSKLAQWEIVFDHMDRLGLAQHVVMQETENDDGSNGLDNGNLGLERKLYHRELVARFGHHPALIWNLGEENSQGTDDLTEIIAHLGALDVQDHPMVVHTFPGQKHNKWDPLLAAGLLEGASMQISAVSSSHAETLEWRAESEQAGTPWAVFLDEIGSANSGVKPDADDFWHDGPRVSGLWGNLMAGGAGCEWYFGYSYPHDDLDCEDWRSRDNMWRLTDHALDFFETHLPYAEMVPDDALVSGPNFCLAQVGQVYAVYLTDGGSPTLDLGSSAGSFSVQWYDPRVGGPLQTGTIGSVTGPGVVALGLPPSDTGEDWAVLVKPDNAAPVIEAAVVAPDPFLGSQDLVFRVAVSDPDGPGDIAQVLLYVFHPSGLLLAALPMNAVGVGQYSIFAPNVPALPAGLWPLAAQVMDTAGLEDVMIFSFTAL